MSLSELISMLPLMILAGAPVLLLIIIAFYRNHILTASLTALAFVSAIFSMGEVTNVLPQSPSALLIIDSFGWFYTGLLILTSLFITVLSFFYFQHKSEQQDEIYVLLLTATLGACVLALSRNMISFFMGFEVLSVSLYVMIAFLRKRKISIEAGIKYLILAAASSAILLFGFALIYTELGTMDFYEIGRQLQSREGSLILFGGLGLAFTGFGFKLALVPFHLWTADVYQGAPAPVTAFIATVSKGGSLAVLLRFFDALGGVTQADLILVISIIAMASMLIGNILALLQNNLKRLLAYSSIAHLGYVLVAFIAGGENGLQAATFYIVAYIITILTAFGVLIALSGTDEDAEQLESYKALFWRRPWMAFLFTLSLFSLAGIPLTAGFMGKYLLLISGVGANLWALLIVLVISSVIGLFYYLRIIMHMLAREEAGKNVPFTWSTMGTTLLSLIAILLIWIGIYPTPLLEMIANMIILS